MLKCCRAVKERNCIIWQEMFWANPLSNNVHFLLWIQTKRLIIHLDIFYVESVLVYRFRICILPLLRSGRAHTPRLSSGTLPAPQFLTGLLCKCLGLRVLCLAKRTGPEQPGECRWLSLHLMLLVHVCISKEKKREQNRRWRTLFHPFLQTLCHLPHTLLNLKHKQMKKMGTKRKRKAIWKMNSMKFKAKCIN